MTFDENSAKYRHGFFHIRTITIIIVALQMTCFWYELINFSVERTHYDQNASGVSRVNFNSKNQHISNRSFFDSNKALNNNISSENRSMLISRRKPIFDTTYNNYDKFCGGAWSPVRNKHWPHIAAMLWDGIMLLFCIFVINAVRLTVPKLILPKLVCDFLAAYTAAFNLGRMLIVPLSTPYAVTENFWYYITLNVWCAIVNSYIFYISFHCFKYLSEKKSFFERAALDILSAAAAAVQQQALNINETFVDLPPPYHGLPEQSNAEVPAAPDDTRLPTYEEAERLASSQIKNL